MKPRAMCCVLVLSGCATGSSSRAVTAAATPGSFRSQVQSAQVQSEEILAEPVRLESSAGTFLVHPNTAQELLQVLAGEPARHPYISLDVP